MKSVLGISCFYHDSAACLARDGVILAAAQEERFSRKKHDPSFPHRAIAACMREANVDWDEIEAIVLYDKPLLKFERLIETFVACAPRGWRRFLQAGPVWAKEKLFQKKGVRRLIAERFGVPENEQPQIGFTEHHHAHAASAFFPSPFQDAAVLCLDGVGEWATTSAWLGESQDLKPLWQIDFPHSLGLFYSAFTYHCGFRVNSGEYKLMGLAPFGEPRFVETIRERLIDVKEDGTFRLNCDYFDFLTGDAMTGAAFDDLFGAPARVPESPLSAREADMAASAQVVVEEVVLRLARTLRKETGQQNLCLAGGVALNCVANGALLRADVFEKLWIQPAAGDAGGALGAAMAWDIQRNQSPRVRAASDLPKDAMAEAALGPGLERASVERALNEGGAKFQWIEDEAALLDRVADRLAEGAVVGWARGRMEFGPRALGGRSILADPRGESMRSDLNRKIKFRESFRPFAPVVCEEEAARFFDLDCESPYMLLVAPVRGATVGDAVEEGFLDRLASTVTALPAVTHVDGSARVQTVSATGRPDLHALLRRFEARSGIPVLVNTSFNVRGEPIVADAADAFRCFMRCHMDVLVVENALLEKREQTLPVDLESWRQEFPLD